MWGKREVMRRGGEMSERGREERRRRREEEKTRGANVSYSHFSLFMDFVLS